MTYTFNWLVSSVSKEEIGYKVNNKGQIVVVNSVVAVINTACIPPEKLIMNSFSFNI